MRRRSGGWCGCCRCRIAAALATIALKTAAWALTGSVGLLSDAAEAVVNLVAAVFALLIVQWAARPRTRSTRTGTRRPIISAGVEGGLILVAAVTIGVSAVDRLLDPQPLSDVGVGIAVSLLASGLNLGVARLLIGAGRQHGSLTLEADRARRGHQHHRHRRLARAPLDRRADGPRAPGRRAGPRARHPGALYGRRARAVPCAAHPARGPTGVRLGPHPGARTLDRQARPRPRRAHRTGSCARHSDTPPCSPISSRSRTPRPSPTPSSTAPPSPPQLKPPSEGEHAAASPRIVLDRPDAPA
jgi:Cation efflux family